jgi:hypothetical protein
MSRSNNSRVIEGEKTMSLKIQENPQSRQSIPSFTQTLLNSVQSVFSIALSRLTRVLTFKDLKPGTVEFDDLESSDPSNNSESGYSDPMSVDRVQIVSDNTLSILQLQEQEPVQQELNLNLDIPSLMEYQVQAIADLQQHDLPNQDLVERVDLKPIQELDRLTQPEIAAKDQSEPLHSEPVAFEHPPQLQPNELDVPKPMPLEPKTDEPVPDKDYEKPDPEIVAKLNSLLEDRPTGKLVSKTTWVASSDPVMSVYHRAAAEVTRVTNYSSKHARYESLVAAKLIHELGYNKAAEVMAVGSPQLSHINRTQGARAAAIYLQEQLQEGKAIVRSVQQAPQYQPRKRTS